MQRKRPCGMGLVGKGHKTAKKRSIIDVSSEHEIARVFGIGQIIIHVVKRVRRTENIDEGRPEPVRPPGPFIYNLLNLTAT
jgi:hypothetical protein